MIAPAGLSPIASVALAAEGLLREAEGLMHEALQRKGGWREAIVELEDHCSEPVRLKNMLAAADQLDDFASKARALLSEMG